jgi:hypothetical protein
LDQLAIAVRQDKDQRIEDVLLKIFRFNVKNVQYEIDGDDIEKSLSTRESRALKSYQGVSGGEDTENALFPLIERTRTPRYQ